MDYKIPLQRKIYGGDLGPDLLNFCNGNDDEISVLIHKRPVNAYDFSPKSDLDLGPGDCSVTPASESPFGQPIHTTLSPRGHCLIMN
jgi:hypothetical protein